MDDAALVQLLRRDAEAGMRACIRQYYTLVHSICSAILRRTPEDAEECVNDTWLHAWNAIPPQRPRMLRPFLGRITRNLAINLWQKNHAQKRYAGMELLLDELADCVPSSQTVELHLEAEALGDLISAWLRTLPAGDRRLFLRRYWNGESLQDLAKESNEAPERLAQRTYRLRQSLRAELERNGIFP